MFLFLFYLILASSLLSVLSDSNPKEVIQNLAFRLDIKSTSSCDQPDDNIKISLYCNSSQILTTNIIYPLIPYEDCINNTIPDITQIFYTCNSDTPGIQIITENSYYIYNNSVNYNGLNTINLARYDRKFNFTISLNLSDSTINDILNNKKTDFEKILYCNSDGELSFNRDLNTNAHDGCLPQTLENHYTKPFIFEKYTILFQKTNLFLYGNIYFFDEKYRCNHKVIGSDYSLSNISFACKINLISKSLPTYKYFNDFIICFDGYHIDTNYWVKKIDNKLVQGGRMEFLGYLEDQFDPKYPLEPCELGCDIPNNLSTFGLELSHDIDKRHAILKCEEGKEKKISGEIICRTMGEEVYNWYSGEVIIDVENKYVKYGCSLPVEGNELSSGDQNNNPSTPESDRDTPNDGSSSTEPDRDTSNDNPSIPESDRDTPNDGSSSKPDRDTSNDNPSTPEPDRDTPNDGSSSTTTSQSGQNEDTSSKPGADNSKDDNLSSQIKRYNMQFMSLFNFIWYLFIGI